MVTNIMLAAYSTFGYVGANCIRPKASLSEGGGCPKGRRREFVGMDDSNQMQTTKRTLSKGGYLSVAKTGGYHTHVASILCWRLRDCGRFVRA